MYPDNTLAVFTCNLTRPIDLSCNDTWEVGPSEFSCSPLKTGVYEPGVMVIGVRIILIYCNLISPQLVGEHLVQFLRTYMALWSECQHIFDHIYHISLQKRIMQDLRVEIFTMEGKR
jgi:hypothetical protein